MRALRRHHKRRMKRRAVRAFDWMDRQNAERLAEHMKACSCYMCCNHRRNKWLPLQQQITRQERAHTLEKNQ